MLENYCIKCEEITESDFAPAIVDDRFFEEEKCVICTHTKAYFDKEGNKIVEPRGVKRGQLLITSFCIAPKRKEQAKDLVKSGKYPNLSELFRRAADDLIVREHPNYLKEEA